MVAEAVAAPVTETTQGNASEPAADAAESQEVNDYFSSKGKESEKPASESVGEEAPPEDEFPELTEARRATAAATEERVERETVARIERETRERQAAIRATEQGQQFAKNYADRVNTTRQEVYDDLTQAGYSHEQALEKANKYANRLNEHHADGLKLYEPQAVELVAGSFNASFNDGMRDVLTKDEQRAFFGEVGAPTVYGSVKEALAAAVAVKTKDLLTPKEATAQAKAEVLKYQKWLEDNNRLVGTRSTRRAVTGTSGNSKTYSTQNAADAAHVAGEITSAQREVIRRDRNVPWA